MDVDKSPRTAKQVKDRLDNLGMRVLDVFYEVVSEGGFTAAAKNLNLSQPTVSQHIKKMENVLGDKLFFRSSNELKLTRLGRICHEQIQSINRARENFKDSLFEYYDVRSRTVSFGCSTIPGEFFVPSLLTEYSQKYPEYCVDITIKDSRKIEEMVHEGEMRLGIVGSSVDRQQIKSNLLFRDEMVLVGAPSNYCEKITPEELVNYPYVGREEGSGTRKAVQEALYEDDIRIDEELDYVARVDTIQAVRECVLEGAGVSFLPWSVVQKQVQHGHLTVLGEGFSDILREFNVIENKFLGLSTPLQSFKEFLLYDGDNKYGQNEIS